MTAGRNDMKIAGFFLAAFLAAVAAGDEATFRPFKLPPSAYVTESNLSGGGWLESGVILLTYVQAEAGFMTEMSRQGWRFVHSTTLNDGMTAGTSRRKLSLWRCGRRELTLMLWRIDVGKTGFSWGIAEAKENEQRRI